MSKKLIDIAVANGDGIGKEIMSACLKIFAAAKVPLNYHHVEMGKEVYLKGNSTGMTDLAKDTVEKFGILYKGPMETPKGAGVKSINVTARKVWSTFANKRVFMSIPGVETVFSKAGIPINLTIVRENIEDTYGGIEHMQSNDVAQCRRLITRPGCEQVHRYAFEMARNKKAHRVTCAHKANIMKLTDGLFLKSFYDVAKEYPDLNADDIIVDDLAMKLVSIPHKFDVIVLPNLQGDIMSDLCAGLVGGLGVAPSANVGDHISIFEAVHGTAPDITGKNLANPTSLLLSGIMMLRHLHLNQHADVIKDALITTLKQGYRTLDLVSSKPENRLLTTEFTDAIINNIPKDIQYAPVKNEYKHPIKPVENLVMTSNNRNREKEMCVGVDFFVDCEFQPNQLANYVESSLKKFATENVAAKDLKCTMLSNRGTQVWPTGSVFTECINHYRVRIENPLKKHVSPTLLMDFVKSINSVNKNTKDIRVASLEMLMSFDGVNGFSMAQGQ